MSRTKGTDAVPRRRTRRPLVVVVLVVRIVVYVSAIAGMCLLITRGYTVAAAADLITVMTVSAAGAAMVAGRIARLPGER